MRSGGSPIPTRSPICSIPEHGASSFFAPSRRQYRLGTGARVLAAAARDDCRFFTAASAFVRSSRCDRQRGRVLVALCAQLFKIFGEKAVSGWAGALRLSTNLIVPRHGILGRHSLGRGPPGHEHTPLSRVEALGAPLISASCVGMAGVARSRTCSRMALIGGIQQRFPRT